MCTRTKQSEEPSDRIEALISSAVLHIDCTLNHLCFSQYYKCCTYISSTIGVRADSLSLLVSGAGPQQQRSESAVAPCQNRTSVLLRRALASAQQLLLFETARSMRWNALHRKHFLRAVQLWAVKFKNSKALTMSLLPFCMDELTATVHLLSETYR